MKKIICAVLALIMIVAVAVPGVGAADKPEKLLLLGDSITYGYGLEGDRDTCMSYGNMLRDFMGVSPANFKNAAVNGDTSSDLLALLPSLQKDVQAADMIVITIGGNDLLGLIWEAGAYVLGSAFNSNGQLLDIMADAAKMAKLMEYLTTEKVSAAIMKYTTNLAAIISFIRSNNATAQVLFLAQYDPMNGVDGLGALSVLADTSIKMLNTVMQAQAVSGGCSYVDVYTPFVGRAADWTNIMMADIHPNFLGHEQIFKIIKSYLGYVEQETTTPAPVETTTPAPVVTTPTPVETTTPVPVETTTPAPVETTPAPAETTPADAPAAVTTLPEEDDADVKGCGSVVSVSLMAVIALGGAVIFKKRK